METISRCLLTFIVNSLWQIPLVAAVAMLASRLMRNGPASHRHAVWVAALLAGLLLPLTSIPISQPGAATLIKLPPVTEPGGVAAHPPLPAALVAATPAPASHARSVSFGRTTAGILLGVYLLFLLAGVGKLAGAWWRTAGIRRRAEARPTPRLLEQVWARCLRVFSLRGVELRSSASVPSPVAAGAWRCIIILPELLFEETSEEVLTTAVGHEMAHIARHDFALNLLYEMVWLPVAFHPAAWVIRRGIERTREMACDELVTRQLMDPRVYAQSIVNIARSMTSLRHPGYTLGVFDGDILEERIRRLVERPAANLKRARLLLATGLSALALCAAIASGLALTARAQSGSRDEMKLAADAYNRGDFPTASQHFANAVKLEPANIEAKLSLANALLRQFTPGSGQSESPLVTEARRQCRDVLTLDNRNKTAVAGMMQVALDTRQFDEGHGWALKLIELDPRDTGGYYTAAFVDWSVAYPVYARARLDAGIEPQDPGIIPDAGSRKSLRDRFLPGIEEGLRMLHTALEIDPAFSDAMAYMNLLYRMKSGMVDSPAESADLLSQADEWVTKAVDAIKRQASEKRADVGNPPPPASISTMAVAPPPPPPPPPPRDFGKGPVSSLAVPPHNPTRYWQVAPVASGMDADTLVRTLAGKGFHAIRVVSGADNLVRVMAGPYDDPQSFEQARAALEAAGFQPLRVW